jgi:hypothetical protein
MVAMVELFSSAEKLENAGGWIPYGGICRYLSMKSAEPQDWCKSWRFARKEAFELSILFLATKGATVA